MLVHQFLETSAGRQGEKIALVCGDRRASYAELESEASRIATALAHLDVQAQDRVIILMENSIASVVALFGILKAGAIFIMLNSTLKPRKLNYILRDSGAKVVIAHARHKETLAAAGVGATDLRHIIWYAAADEDLPLDCPQGPAAISWSQALSNTKGRVPARRILDIDLATIIYTSGSTGEPKGVMSTHLNMVSVARSIMQYLQNTPEDIIFNALPLAFDYGLYQVLMAFAFGGSVILEKSFMYPLSIVSQIAAEKVTGLPLVPTMLALLLEKCDLAGEDLHALRYVTNTAAHLPQPLIKKLRAQLPRVRIYAMYGLTECKRVAYLPPEDIDRKPGSVGLPIPNTQVFILDAQGREAAPGEIGELVVRGANVMQGYWNAPAETARTFRTGRYRSDALLFSGDLFKKDEEGYLYFIARKDDLIKTKGERVSPKEIENALFELEGICEAAAFGIPDTIDGQSIVACVAIKADFGLTRQMILSHCRKNLESFMMPKRLEVFPSLPKKPNGKIDRQILYQIMVKNIAN